MEIWTKKNGQMIKQKEERERKKTEKRKIRKNTH